MIVAGRATALVDGFAQATWTIENLGDAATLIVEPFVAIAAADRDALVAEGHQLLAFTAAHALSHDIRITRGV